MALPRPESDPSSKGKIMNPSHLITLANSRCLACDGRGIKSIDNTSVCKCVYRRVFAACLDCFRNCLHKSPMNGTRLEMVSRAKNCHQVYGRKNEEYMADFLLLAKRTLDGPDSLEYKLFNFHLLLGATGKLVMDRLGLRVPKPTFYHRIERIEEKLGEAFAETKPYGIYPLDEYFGGTTADGAKPRTLAIIPTVRNTEPVRPPLRAV